MSNAIVEAIYSMEPPGRFLKQCAETGQWKELSKRDAADKTAQAMAYAVSGKEKSKRRRERRRQSRQSLPLPQDDVVGAASSQPIDQPAQQPQLHSPKNNLEGNVASTVARDVVAPSSSVARLGLDVSGSTAAGSNNNAESAENDGHTDSVADEMLHVPRNSNLQQQLLQQLQQSSSNNATLPTTLGNSIDQNVNQNGLAQLLLQTLQQQQQQQQQQQLQVQYSCQNPFGLQAQTLPQPALHEGLTQLLYQAQQQQQQQQQLILLHRLMNHQNVLSPASLPTTLSSPAPSSSAPSLSSQGVLPSNVILPNGISLNYSLGRQSQSTNNNILQNLQQQSNPSNALLLGMLSNLQNQPNIGTFNAPHEAQQHDQLQRSLMLQQNQLLATSLTASNQSIRQQQQQQQSLPLGPLHRSWQTALLPHIQNSQNPPPINVQPSANTADLSDRQVDKEQSVSEEENRK